MKEFWSNNTSKASTLKAVVSSNGLLIAKNYVADELKSGDLGLTIRLDRVKAGNLTPEQKLAAQSVAQAMTKEFLESLGIVSEALFYQVNQVVKISNIDKREEIFYGLFLNMTSAHYFISVLNEKGKLVTRTFPIIRYDLQACEPYTGYDGLVAYQGMTENIWQFVPKMKDQKLILDLVCHSFVKENIVEGLKMIEGDVNNTIAFDRFNLGLKGRIKEDERRFNSQYFAVYLLTRLKDENLLANRLLALKPPVDDLNDCREPIAKEVARVTSQKKLFALYRKAKNEIVQKSAFKLLSDPKLVQTVFKADAKQEKLPRWWYENASVILPRIQDLTWLVPLAKKWNFPKRHVELQELAKLMVSQATEEQAVELALEASSIWVRNAAVDKLESDERRIELIGHLGIDGYNDNSQVAIKAARGLQSVELAEQFVLAQLSLSNYFPDFDGFLETFPWTVEQLEKFMAATQTLHYQHSIGFVLERRQLNKQKSA